MMALTLAIAQTIIKTALAKGHEIGLKPLTVAVLDAGGHLIALERQDGASNLRPEIAQGKARGAVSMGIGSRALGDRAEQQAYFIQSVNALSAGSLVPVAGGVLVKEAGKIIGAVGVTGDTSDNDEIVAIAGIEAVGFVADGG
ncbi:heme-binding protein [Alphaproteobacteria bacterium]|nr:heme-binding protein [Alphaproteobacteria bacterium]